MKISLVSNLENDFCFELEYESCSNYGITELWFAFPFFNYLITGDTFDWSKILEENTNKNKAKTIIKKDCSLIKMENTC